MPAIRLALVFPCLLTLWLSQAMGAGVPATDPALVAETTQFRETGRYDEVEQRCRDWPRRYPQWVRCETVGRTAEGRTIRALVISKGAPLSPRPRQQHPVVLLIGGAHAGEIDGKDAGLILLRELLASNQPNNPLQHLTVVFVPVFNVDGHENRGRYLRPNQNGPLEPGDRLTAQRINLNRDWMLAQTPEMQAMLRLVQRWDPDVTLDLHVTDGIRYRHNVAISHAPMFSPHAEVQSVSKLLLQQVISRLTRRGHAPLDFYPVLNDPEDPSLGMTQEVDTPRFSHVYATIRNRIGFLVEDHAWDDYAARVRTCKATVLASLETIAAHRDTLIRTLAEADVNSQRLRGTTLPLDWYNTADIGPTQSNGNIELQGYRYEVFDEAPVSAGRGIRYDITQPETWNIPLFNHIRPLPQAMQTLPEGGYLVPAGWAAIVRPYLSQHGVRHRVIARALKEMRVESMRVQDDDVAFEPRPFQGRTRTQVNGRWATDTVTLPPGSLFIPMDQPNAWLAAQLLEPSAPDSLSSWGIFNTAYELSDLIAGHRELELARWMVTQHPTIRTLFGEAVFNQLTQWRQAFEERLLRDAAFAADPQARLNFWISKLPPHDPGYNLYPIFRTASTQP